MFKNLVRKWKEWKSGVKGKNGDPEKIVCVVGESGSGKSTLIEMMEAHGYKALDSYTTRARRHPNEGHHTFVDQAGFDAIRHDLVAHTSFNGFEYGATRSQIRESHLYAIDPYGVEVLSQTLGRHKILVVYIFTTETERLERMTETRGQQAAEERINHDREKFAGFTDYDYFFFNNDPQNLEVNKELLLQALKNWYGR